MASLPVRLNEVPRDVERVRRAQFKLAEMILDNDGDWRGICLQLAKGDELAAKRWRQRLRRWMREDEYFQGLIAAESMAEMRLATPGTVQAVARRATKGNIPAAKLGMEVSGFYNPRMEHHHSGKIEVELKGVPRPAPTTDEDHSNEATIYEADVVEE